MNGQEKLSNASLSLGKSFLVYLTLFVFVVFSSLFFRRSGTRMGQGAKEAQISEVRHQVGQKPYKEVGAGFL